MSRLIVKNLPKNVTADKLRETFSTKGTVTDIQLKYTKDGKFRHFGFVGFKTEEEGKAALEYFNNTYLNSSKITLELCANLGDPNKPKSWSKYSSDSSAAINKNKSVESNVKDKKNKKKDKEEVKNLLEKHKDDPLFAEFIETHMKTNKTVWSNDAVLDEGLPKVEMKSSDEKRDDVSSNDSDGGDSSEDEKADNKGLEQKEADNVEEEDGEGALANQEISDMEYLQRLKGVKTEEKEDDSETKKSNSVKKKKEHLSLFTVKIRGLGFKARKSHVRHFFHPLKPYSIRLPPKIKGIAYVGFRTEKEVKQALAKNKGFLAGRQLMVTRHGDGDDNDVDKNREENDPQWKWKDQEESLRNEETIGESGRIFIRNLAHTVVEEDIETLFSKYGPIAEVNVPVDRLTRKPKGFATVMFMIPEHAVAAYSDLDGKVLHGRMLHLLPGKAKPDIEDMDGLTYKQKKEKQLKDQAKSSHNWNTLFLGQNAVAEAIARTYDTTKEKVLDSSGKNSVAVRLALGETQLVNQTRDFLLENGVSLSAFEQAPKKRSKTILLVKNLPAGTESSEIRSMFEKHAMLGRVLLPPSGLTAIVEFSDPSEARTAFRKLAYTKFKNLPLFLEWAPEDTFGSGTSVEDVEDPNKKTIKEENEETEHEIKDEAEIKDESKDDEEPEADTTLFVKNLNFDTREKALEEHFRKCGKIHSATIALKKDAKRPGELLSMGYGFIQFKKKSSAEKALKTLQNSKLDGHEIELRRSNRTVQTEVLTARKKSTPGIQTGSKILVRNIPFEATSREVTELFQTFGELKFVRLPKKLIGTGSHRGFGFVEYLTKADAKQAFKALSQSTHLYGRRLVLEWASNEEDVDELRKRTAQHFSESAPKQSKKSVLNPDEMDED